MELIFRGNLKDKQATAFREWETANAEALQSHAPSGWKYLGAFFTVFGFGKYDVETRWQITKYGDLDAARNHNDDEWMRLTVEQGDFFEPTVPGETSLMMTAQDVKILE